MELWFGVVALTLILFPFLLHRKPKKTVEEDSGKISTSSARLGIWRSLKISLMMLLYPKIPNYEVVNRKSREYSISDLALVDIPTRKEGLLLVLSLSLAKKIMSSMLWMNHFRDNYYMFNCTWNKPYGLLFGGGEYWREGRSITVRLLHKLEFFRQEKMESLIRREVEEILEKIEKKLQKSGGEGTFSPYQMFEVNALNLISQVCWSERYQESDPFVTTVLPPMNRINRVFNVGYGILEIFPWATKFPSLTFYGVYKEAHDSAVAYFKNILKQRRGSGTYETAPEDLTDYFLQEIDLKKNPEVINGKGSDVHIFRTRFLPDQAYYVIMRDLVWAGTATTSGTMEHVLLHLALRPEVQQRVQREIDETVGRWDLPSYADRTRMPYTQAVILEILRYGIPVPLTSRSNTVDIQLDDQQVPKGSLCAISIYSIHRSQELWDDPDEFRPERFLSEDGKIINTEKIIPFGYGKRICIGESLARTFIFITLVTLLQRYEFQLSKQHPPPGMENTPGLSRCPLPYYLTVKARN